jgi:hypothetical protein
LPACAFTQDLRCTDFCHLPGAQISHKRVIPARHLPHQSGTQPLTPAGVRPVTLCGLVRMHKGSGRPVPAETTSYLCPAAKIGCTFGRPHYRFPEGQVATAQPLVHGRWDLAGLGSKKAPTVRYFSEDDRRRLHHPTPPLLYPVPRKRTMLGAPLLMPASLSLVSYYA